MTQSERILKPDSDRPPSREALTREAHLMGLEIEHAERHGDYAGARHFRARYHTAMADLHATSADRYRERRGEFLWARRDHQQLAELARAEGVVA